MFQHWDSATNWSKSMQTNTPLDTYASAHNIHGLAVALDLVLVLVLVETIDGSPDGLAIQALVNSLKSQTLELATHLDEAPRAPSVKAVA
jgi:hypothetical protein